MLKGVSATWRLRCQRLPHVPGGPTDVAHVVKAVEHELRRIARHSTASPVRHDSPDPAGAMSAQALAAQAQPGPHPPAIGAPDSADPVELPTEANTESTRRVRVCPFGHNGAAASESDAGRRCSKTVSHSLQRNS